MYVGSGRHVSLGSFRTKADAERALLLAVADRERGAWVDPRNGKLTLAAYAEHWLEHRHGLRIRTVELYRSQLDNHILPALGRRELSKLSTAEVRAWHAGLTKDAGLAPTTAAKCYRLLRSILNTAVEDELIVKNPCIIKGAGTERSPERPIATIAQVDALADAIDPRWRALVLLATYGSLRWGELTALTRQRIDLQPPARWRWWSRRSSSPVATRVLGPPKTDAGRRMVTLPAFVVDELVDHLATLRRARTRRDRVHRAEGRAAAAQQLVPEVEGGGRVGRLRRTSTSTTCATPATRSPPRPARAPRS